MKKNKDKNKEKNRIVAVQIDPEIALEITRIAKETKRTYDLVIFTALRDFVEAYNITEQFIDKELERKWLN